MAVTIHKCNPRNVCVKGLHEPSQVLSSLESIADKTDQQVAKMRKSSILILTSSFFLTVSQTTTMTIEAIII